MQIDQVRLVFVPVELSSPLRTSHGVHRSRIATLVEITDARGFVGWGENVAPIGVDYVGEDLDNSLRVMYGTCIPVLTSRSFELGDVDASTWWGVEGNNFAKHAIESALWDIEAQSRGVSLVQLLGGTHSSVTPGVVVGLHDSIDDVLAECALRISQGYQRLKVKIEPGHDIDVLREVRRLIGDDVVLQADANGAYLSSDIDTLKKLADVNLQFIEQPFAADDVQAHIQLSQSGALRVCMDESICSQSDLVEMLTMGACSVVNVKPSRVGGIGEAVKMHNIVYERGVDAWVGGMLETGIGRASCLALASMQGFTMTPDLSASNRYFAHDITTPFELVDGKISVPSGLGLGVVPRDEMLQHSSTRIETVFER